jgi:hypothetical protein
MCSRRRHNVHVDGNCFGWLGGGPSFRPLNSKLKKTNRVLLAGDFRQKRGAGWIFCGLEYGFSRNLQRERTMKNFPNMNAARVFILSGFFCAVVRAQNLDTIGVVLLRTVTTNLSGAGIPVAQAEAGLDTNNPPLMWQVNPAATGQPTNLFTYISSGGSSSNYPNSLGSESGHADQVAGNFYGIAGGVATNVEHVDNFEADYFYDSILAAALPPNIHDAVVNQSFTFGTLATNDQQMVDSQYDNYAVQYGTLFISAVDNGGDVHAPGTSYNGIGVAAYGGSSSVGPTIDNGRAKPDITAPADATSFSTPQVAGAAALLIQAALRGDGGSATNLAADIRMVKALLLNGAIKSADWTNNSPSPLDPRYGAGVLNVFNSYEQLVGGKHGYIVSTSVASGSMHPPTGATGTESALSGWDFNTNSGSTSLDGVNHYYFNVTNGWSGAQFTATATLVWNRQFDETNINDLDLFLYDTFSSNLVACSTSLVDNVEHIWLPRLPQGRYDLQVLKNGGTNTVSDSETYALAFEFFSQTASIAQSGTNVILSWPAYPAGFTVMTATNLAPANWNEFTNIPAVVTNQQNQLLLNPTNANQFFRLQRP